MRWVAWVLVSYVVAFLSIAPAAAQETASNTERARAMYVEGSTAAEEARWTDALRLFQESYDLSHNPAALFNVATTLRAVGRHRESRDALDRLLRDHAELPEELRAEAQRIRGQVAARVATISINNAPARADLTLRFDGQTTPTPPERPIRMEADPGRHSVDFEANADPQLQSFHWEALVTDGQVAAVDVSMPEVSHDSLASSPWFWTLVGVVVVGATVATLLYVDHQQQLEPQGQFRIVLGGD
ncbi:MAG: hypothetical protein IPK60_23275 [Sandaracinaceae bacterium]|nr:hypothetical protein [Sandaracinaceae bacterium]